MPDDRSAASPRLPRAPHLVVIQPGLALGPLETFLEARLWPAGQDVVDRFLRDAKVDIVSVDADRPRVR